MPDGSDVRIRYIPSEPRTAEIEGEPNHGKGELFGAGAVILIGIPLTLWAYLKRP